jgi:hypothetical protein
MYNFTLSPLDKEVFITLANKALGNSVWKAEEMAEAYRIVNLLTGSTRKDTGCGSCRRDCLAQLKRAYSDFQKTQS